MKTRSKIIGTRFYPDELELIRELAESRGLSMSEQLREAIMLHVLRVGASTAPRARKTVIPETAA